jgi:hypothetical protein
LDPLVSLTDIHTGLCNFGMALKELFQQTRWTPLFATYSVPY